MNFVRCEVSLKNPRGEVLQRFARNWVGTHADQLRKPCGQWVPDDFQYTRLSDELHDWLACRWSKVYMWGIEEDFDDARPFNYRAHIWVEVPENLAMLFKLTWGGR